MGTLLGLTRLLSLLLLVLLPDPLIAFPEHSHDVPASHGHVGYNYNPPPVTYHPPFTTKAPKHHGYNYDPPAHTYSPPHTTTEHTTEHGYNYDPPAHTYSPPVEAVYIDPRTPSYEPPLPEEEGVIGVYESKYAVKDATAGLDFGHDQTAVGNAVDGEYHVLLPDGTTQKVTYHVDKESGYVATVTYEHNVEYKPPTPADHYNQPTDLYEPPEIIVDPHIFDIYEPPVITESPPSHVYETPATPPLEYHEPDHDGPLIDLRSVFGHRR